MIINGGSRSNAAFFARHLTSGEQNERVTLCDMRNLAATTIPDALREMQAVASGTRCRNYFYHANINPKEHEHLTAAQWEQAVDTLEAYLRLEGHARFVVEHTKEGRTHRHVIWSRINITHMRAVKMTDDYEKHQLVARELERKFNLERGTSVLGPDKSGPRPRRRPKTWESFRGQKSGIDPWELTQNLTQLFHATKTGAAFAAALDAHGCKLIRGNRCDYCVVDEAGHLHSLARRLHNISAGEVRERMKDVELPCHNPH